MECLVDQCRNRKGSSRVNASFVCLVLLFVSLARVRHLLRKRRRPDPIARDAKASSEACLTDILHDAFVLMAWYARGVAHA